MKLVISHQTVYRYDARVAHSTQYLRLTPFDSPRQKVLGWQLGLPARATRGRDAYGNWLHTLTLDYPHNEIAIFASGTVETADTDEEEADGLSPLLFLRATPLTRPSEAIRAFADGFALKVAQDRYAGLSDMMQALLDVMPYRSGQTDVATNAAEAFASGAGVCQDHAHVFAAACRELGVPARYVSGYLHTERHDHVASHAWVEAWVDHAWHGFDPANGCHTNGSYLKLAVGMDYLDACPVRGVRIGGGHEQMESLARVTQAGQQQQQ